MTTLMIQGTTSDAGKSTVVAGLCRVLKRRGLSVAPFKPQNMALNSAVTSDGGEIGRSTALQAQAAGVLPHSDMNPVLLKPETDRGAQVILRGKVHGHMDALDYHADEGDLGKTVGDDFAEGKTTLPVMMAYHKGDDEEQAFWKRTITDGEIKDGDLAHAQALMQKHGAITSSLAEARRHAEQAEACLASLPATPARDALIETAAFAASRTV